MKPSGGIADVQPDGSVEVVLSFDAETKLTAASLGDTVREAADADLEIRLTRSDRKRVLEVAALKSAHIADPCQILAIRRGGEGELGVAAQPALAFVIVLIVDRESRQSVGDLRFALGQGLDNVGRLAKRMRGGVVSK